MALGYRYIYPSNARIIPLEEETIMEKPLAALIFICMAGALRHALETCIGLDNQADKR